MAYSGSFGRWIQKVRVASRRLVRGMQAAWPLYEAPEISIMHRLKAVKEEARPNLYGSSFLRSKVIALNPKTLGSDAIMWATSAVHEAEHGIYGGDEGPATAREFKFLGKLYKRSVNTGKKGVAAKAVKAAMIAMKQRKRMVEASRRKSDKALLMKSGFSERAAQFIMGA